MGTIKNEYKSFLDDVEKNIKSKEDLEYVKKRFTSFLDVMLDQIDNIMDDKKEALEQLENRQKEIEEKMSKMQKLLDNIEKDIYSDGEFDFESMEYRTDDILRIIKNCGGDICEYKTIFKNQREGDKIKCQNMKQLEKI